MTVRLTRRSDLHALGIILEDTELFPAEMLPDMVERFFSDPESREVWLTCEADGDVAGFCFAMPEELTNGTWNLIAIAVAPTLQGAGLGCLLVSALEDRLRAAGHRILIVETSGMEAFRQTRAFYEKRGFTEEARIRDFWADGDDKITFWKRLQQGMS